MSKADQHRRSTISAVLLAVFLIQFVMFALFAVISVYQDTASMNPQWSFNVGIDIAGILVSFVLQIICISELDRRDGSDETTVWFSTMLSAEFFALFCDALSWVLDGRAHMVSTAVLANSVLFATCIFVPVAFWGFFTTQIELPEKRKRLIWLAIGTIATVGFVLIVINASSGFYFFYDAQGCYCRGDMYWLVYFFPMAIMSIVLVVSFLHPGDMRTRVGTALFLVCPVIVSVAQVSYYGYNFVYIASLLTVLFLYGNVYVERGSELARQEAVIARRESQLANQRISVMMSQTQPHFLYNSLTAIMGIPGNPPETKEAIANFGKYLRGNLDSLSTEGLIPFTREMDHVRNYVSLEKLRFRTALEVEYTLNCTDFKIPSLTVQMLMENAIKHGVTAKEGGGTVALITNDLGHSWEIMVIDDGVGFDPKAPREPDGRSHVGLSSVRNRLEQMQGGTLSITSAPGQGTVATVRIPKEWDGGVAIHTPA